MKQVEIYINDTNIQGTLEVSEHEDFPFALNFRIADIKDIGGYILGSYAKDFLIPSTHTNSILYEYIENVNIATSATDIYLTGVKELLDKKSVLIKCNEQYIASGKIRIEGIKRINNIAYYKFQVMGDNTEWLDLAENSLVYTYNWGINILHNASLIAGSWTSQPGTTTKYYYPLINYGKWNCNNYTIPGNPISFNKLTAPMVDDFRPAVYIWDIINSGFKDIGYTFSSAFFGGTFFTNLIMPFSKGEFKTAINTAYNFGVKKLTSQSLPAVVIGGGGTVPSYVKINFETWRAGEGTNFSLANDKFTVGIGQAGAYTFSASLYLTADFLGLDVSLVLRVNGNSVLDIKSSAVNISSGQTMSVFVSGTWNLQLGDYVELYLSYIGKGTIYPNATYTYFKCINSGEIIEGTTYNISDTIDTELTLLDVIKGLAHMFNLYFFCDSRLKKIYIEPRDSFYKTMTDSRDWSDKIDVDSEYEIEFISDYNRTLKFNYKEDSKDGYVSERNKLMLNVAGEGEVDLGSKFKKGITEKTNPTFSYTYGIYDKEINRTWIKDLDLNKYPYFNYQDGIWMARMWNVYAPDNTPPPASWKFNFRILRKVYDYQTDSKGNHKWWALMQRNGTYIWYEKVPTGVMISGGQVTSENLYFDGADGLMATYYGKTIKYIKSNILLKIKLALNTFDLLKLDFRYPVYFSKPADIKGYWILNSVNDFSPFNDGVTEVELIKLINLEPVAVTTKNGYPTLPFGEVSAGVGMGSGPPIVIGSGRTPNPIPTPGVPVPDRPCISLPGNNTSSGSGSVNLAIGGIALGNEQTTLGRYNDPNTTDILQIGSGTSNDDRVTALAIDTNGILHIYGGDIYIITDTDEVLPVYVEINNLYEQIYLKH